MEKDTDIKNHNKAVFIIEICIRVLIILISLYMIKWYRDSLIISFGSVVGTAFFCAVILCTLLFTKVKAFVIKLRKTRWGKIIVNTVYVLLGLFVIFVGAAFGAMVYGSEREPAEGATVVVLGCQVRGQEPSLILKTRLDTAYDYLTAHPDAKCILSGGKGSGEDISEAECMYQYLVGRGIDADRLYREDQSVNTAQNISFSEEIIRSEGLNPELAIVTDWYHEMRASVITNRLGYSCGAVSSPTPHFLTANLVTREIFALANEIILKSMNLSFGDDLHPNH
ncbi:MAG: YdcF family protein [Clostridia bacterium]|nr:YdcF family protein [Clostridia bacterium]MBR2175397.1 YdcF family protein [Clostridia bacterium]